MIPVQKSLKRLLSYSCSLEPFYHVVVSCYLETGSYLMHCPRSFSSQEIWSIDKVDSTNYKFV